MSIKLENVKILRKIKNTRNVPYIFMILLAVISVAGCSKNQNEAEKTENEPITFTLFSADLEESLNFDDTIAREITKRTGVYLDFIGPKSNATDDIDLMIANDSYPDLIFAKSDLTKLIEANAVVPLDSYMENYGENIKKLYGSEIVKLRNSLEDPHIYTFGTYAIKTNVLESSGNLQIQNAVLREYQYPKITTLEEYENILLAYKKKYPVINGHKTVGFSFLTDSWYWYLYLSNPGNYVIGYPDDGQWIVDQDSLKATYKFLNPDMCKYYKWLNKIYHEGLLDPESFTQDINIWTQKVKDGCVLGTAAPLWFFQSLQSEMENSGLTERTYAYLPVTVDNKTKAVSFQDYGFSGGWGIAITKNCKDKYRAFKFFDWFCSEEAQILINWGIKDVHYYYDSENIRRSFQNISDSEGLGKWIYPFPNAGEGYIDSTGNTIAKLNLDQIKKSYNSAQKETLEAYGIEMFKELFPSEKELPQSRHGQVWQYQLSPKMSQKVTIVDDFVKESLIKIIIGPEKDFNSSWKKMTDSIIQMGIEDVGDEISRMIQMKIKLWSE